MTDSELTINQLRTILRASAGEADGVDLDGEIGDTEFADLGYDSISLLEAGSRIERDCGVKLDDDLITSAKTPRALIAAVNERLADVERAGRIVEVLNDDGEPLFALAETE